MGSMERAVNAAVYFLSSPNDCPRIGGNRQSNSFGECLREPWMTTDLTVDDGALVSATGTTSNLSKDRFCVSGGASSSWVLLIRPLHVYFTGQSKVKGCAAPSVGGGPQPAAMGLDNGPAD